MCHLYCTRPFESAFQKLITIFPSTQCIRFYSFFIWVTKDIRTISDLFKATHEVGFSNRHRISGLLFPFLCCSLHHSVAKRPFHSVFLRTQPGTDSPAGLRYRREREFVLFFFFPLMYKNSLKAQVSHTNRQQSKLFCYLLPQIK